MNDRSQIPALDLGPELTALRTGLEAAFSRVLDSGEFILGREVEAFERETAEFLGVPHAIGLNSGTDALVIGLRALGIGPGDEVITTPFTFFATAEAILTVGATPIFADVEPDTLTLDASDVARKVGPRTRALLPVHLYGQPAPMDALRSIAGAHGLAVLEDCAQALGGYHGTSRLGTLGRAGAFSFFPSKTLGALGDGGLLATADAELAASARMLRAHGSRRKYENETAGYNSRLDALQAAFLRVKLPFVDARNAARKAAAARYTELLRDVPGVEPLAERVPGEPVYNYYTVRIGGGRRDPVRSELARVGIQTMVYYPAPLHRLGWYEGPPLSLPAAERASAEVLSLPFWPEIAEETQSRVVEAIRSVLGSG